MSLNSVEIQRLTPKDLQKHCRRAAGIKRLCRISKILLEWLIGPWTRLNVCFYKVMIVYWCIFKKPGATMHSWPPVPWCDDRVYARAYMCICVWCVRMYACANVLFRLSPHHSGNVCRVLTLLPKIILFLLALLTPLVLVFLKENKNEILVCIYRFAVCVIYINNTLWNRNTQCPAVVLAFGPFSSTLPYSPCFWQLPHHPPFL